MASWLSSSLSWSSLSRLRFRWDPTSWATRSSPLFRSPITKSHFSTPPVSEETPAMIAIRRQPYPSIGLDLGVFEDNLEDYGTSVALYPEVVAARDPCHILAQLVQNRLFEDAERVYAELTEMGVPIEPNFVYERIALHAIRPDPAQTHLSDDDSRARFLRWWAHVPSAEHPSASGRPFGGVQFAIFSSPVIPDLSLAIQFSLLAASKGYTFAFAPRSVPFVVRYSPPSVSLAFLEQLHQAHDRYLASLDSPPPPACLVDFGSVYSLAARVHCMAGRAVPALDLVQTATTEGILIDDFTYGFLASYLTREDNSDGISVAQKLRDTQLGERRSLPLLGAEGVRGSSEPCVLQDAPELSESTLEVHGSSVPPKDAPLSVALRYLKTAFATRHFPPPSYLAEFIATYKGTGRTRGLLSLRLRAYRNPAWSQSIQHWALAEMLYHVAQGDDLGVILAFGHHFHSVGVPLGTVMLLRRHSKHEGGRDEVCALERPTSVVSNQRFPLRLRPWASSHHTALIWRIAVKRATTLANVKSLYHELLHQVSVAQKPEGTHENPLKGVFTQCDSLLPVPAPSQFDDVHFNIFFKEFINRKCSKLALRVIQDMLQLGIQPGVQMSNLLSTFVKGKSYSDVEVLNRSQKS